MIPPLKTSMLPERLAQRYDRMAAKDKRIQYLDPACGYCRWANSGQCDAHLIMVGSVHNRTELRRAVNALEEITDAERARDA